MTQTLRKSYGITYYTRVLYNQFCLEIGLAIKSGAVHGRRVGFPKKVEPFPVRRFWPEGKNLPGQRGVTYELEDRGIIDVATQ
jgi:hypothetical protein